MRSIGKGACSISCRGRSKITPGIFYASDRLVKGGGGGGGAWEDDVLRIYIFRVCQEQTNMYINVMMTW
jgi:hypothetical protein